MSAPIQNPLLNTVPAKPAVTNPPSAEKSKNNTSHHERDDFKKALSSADQARESKQQAEADAPVSKDDAAVEVDEAATAGNDLPPEKVSAAELPGASLAQKLQQLSEDSLSLELSIGRLSVEQADDAVSLGASLVIDGLALAGREGAKETSLPSAGAITQPELLAKLQKMVGQNGLSLKLEPGLVELDSDPALALTDVVARTAAAAGSGNESKVDGLNAQNSVNESRVTLAAVKTEMVVPNKVGSDGWGDAMAGRIQMLVNQKISSARIHITPPDLGPIEVRVNVNHDQASVQFTSPSAQVRDALEQSIPRLREMLETAGFSLADSGVSDQGSDSGRDSDRSNGDSDSDLAEGQIVETQRRETLGLVDDYV